MALNVAEIINQVTSQDYKANVVKPLTGVVIFLLVIMAYLMNIGATTAGYIVLRIAVLFLLLFAGAYIYCLIKNPDLPRSERYNLEKSAIERVSHIGDGITALSLMKFKNLIQYSIGKKLIYNHIKSIRGKNSCL